MRRQIFVAVLAIPATFGAACGSFGSAADDAPDGGAAVLDATSDSTVDPDGSVPADDGGPVTSCAGRTDIALCEAFESNDFGARGWTADVPAGAELTIAPGAGLVVNAGRFRTPLGVANNGPFLNRPLAGFGNGFVRVFVRTEARPPDPGTYPLIVRAPVEVDIRADRLVLNQYTGAPIYVTSARPVPLGRWFCLEWELKATASTVWVDDAVEIEVAKTLEMPNAFAIGVEYNDVTTGQFAVLYDELAIASTRIGCR